MLYHHINVNDDRDAALANSKKFLDLYYTANYSKERLEAWLTYGTPRDCIEHLKRYKAHGCQRVTFRISTMGDPMAQLRRVTRRGAAVRLAGCMRKLPDTSRDASASLPIARCRNSP